jgi:hypothetical protein
MTEVVVTREIPWLSMPLFREGPPPRSFAADAHGCIMVGSSGI